MRKPTTNCVPNFLFKFIFSYWLVFYTSLLMDCQYFLLGVSSSPKQLLLDLLLQGLSSLPLALYSSCFFGRFYFWDPFFNILQESRPTELHMKWNAQEIQRQYYPLFFLITVFFMDQGILSTPFITAWESARTCLFTVAMRSFFSQSFNCLRHKLLWQEGMALCALPYCHPHQILYAVTILYLFLNNW